MRKVRREVGELVDFWSRLTPWQKTKLFTWAVMALTLQQVTRWERGLLVWFMRRVWEPITDEQPQ